MHTWCQAFILGRLHSAINKLVIVAKPLTFSKTAGTSKVLAQPPCFHVFLHWFVVL